MKDRIRALAVLVAVFLVGIIIGAAGSFFWLKPSTDVVRTVDDIPPPPKTGMTRPPFPELNLSEVQKKQFEEIMAETRIKFEEMEALRRDQMIDLDKRRDSILAEHNLKVGAILAEDQKMKFDNFVSKWNEWLHRASRRIRPEQPRENRRKPARM